MTSGVTTAAGIVWDAVREAWRTGGEFVRRAEEARRALPSDGQYDPEIDRMCRRFRAVLSRSSSTRYDLGIGGRRICATHAGNRPVHPRAGAGGE